MDRVKENIPQLYNNLCSKTISGIGFIFLNYSFFSKRILFR